jgi:hypothetical protein
MFRINFFKLEYQFICFILLLILHFNWFLNYKDKLTENFS